MASQPPPSRVLRNNKKTQLPLQFSSSQPAAVSLEKRNRSRNTAIAEYIYEDTNNIGQEEVTVITSQNVTTEEPTNTKENIQARTDGEGPLADP